MAEQMHWFAQQPARALVSAVVARGGRLALIVRGGERWRPTPGCTFVPVELPGCTLGPGADPSETMSRLTLALLGQAGRLVASARLYGPSAAHAIDRLDPSLEAAPLPLLRLERGVAPEDEEATTDEYGVQRVVVRAYRVALAGVPQPGADVAGILWATPRALRAAMRGLPMSELLAQADVRWQPSENAVLPEDALGYIPGEYGERHLLRVVAKYGVEALFQGGDDGFSDVSGSPAR